MKELLFIETRVNVNARNVKIRESSSSRVKQRIKVIVDSSGYSLLLQGSTTRDAIAFCHVFASLFHARCVYVRGKIQKEEKRLFMKHFEADDFTNNDRLHCIWSARLVD